MQTRRIIWLIAVIIGFVAGAMGTRFGVSAPDYPHATDIPFLELLVSIPIFLFLAWAATAAIGKYAQPFVYVASVLGAYGTAYGASELGFHSINHQNAFTSLSLLLLGIAVLVSCYIAFLLFGNRWREA